jgi:hypothetical protein
LAGVPVDNTLLSTGVPMDSRVCSQFVIIGMTPGSWDYGSA